MGASDYSRFSVGGAYTSSELLRELLEALAIANLHVGLIGMGVPNVTRSRWLLLDCSGRFHYLIIPTHGRGFIEMVQEILAEEATRRALEDRIRGEVEVPSKRRAEDLVGQRKKGKGSSRHRFHHEADGSKSQMSKGNGPIDPVEETPTPRSKLKSVKELCSASPGVDGWDYHAI
ncbi:hypothetical protein BHE74_00036099 [Ensete ventricosum]|nr:hypothetical protein BHE74_00036099 [Ensete ventricosum]